MISVMYQLYRNLNDKLQISMTEQERVNKILCVCSDSTKEVVSV